MTGADVITVAEYLIDHFPSMAGTAIAAFVAYRQSRSQRLIVEVNMKSDRNFAATKDVQTDLRNGLGDAIATKTAAKIQPHLEDVVQNVTMRAEEVAAVLAAKVVPWDGEERRLEDCGSPTGVERRKIP